MTTFIVVTVFDQTAGIFGSPFTAVNKASAERQFHAEQALRPERTPMQTHPEDYSLFAIGSFDNESGNIALLPQPDFICRGSPRED